MNLVFQMGNGMGCAFLLSLLVVAEAYIIYLRQLPDFLTPPAIPAPRKSFVLPPLLIASPLVSTLFPVLVTVFQNAECVVWCSRFMLCAHDTLVFQEGRVAVR